MADLIPNNGFNDEDVLLIPTGLDFSGINDDIKRMSKKLSSLEEDVTIDVDPEALEALKEMQAQIEKLDKEMKNVKMNKISRGQFTKFEKEIREQVKSIEDRLNGLGDALVKVTEQFGKVGTDFDMSKVTEGFKEATEAVKGAITAVGELDQISKGGKSIIIDDSKLNDLEKALKGLKAAETQYKKIDALGNDYLGGQNNENVTLEQLVTRFKNNASAYKNWVRIYNEYIDTYTKMKNDPLTSSDDLHITEVELNRAALEVSNAATTLNNLRPVIEKMQKESGITFIDFDTEKNTAKMREYADIVEQLKDKGKDGEAVIAAMNAEIAKFNEGVEVGKRVPFIEETSEMLPPLINNLKEAKNQFMLLEERSDQASKQIEKTTKQVKAQSTLRDLLENKAIDIEVKTDTKQLEQELNAKVEALQEELRQKAIFVPIRVYVDSTNIADAGKEVGDISPEVSSNKIKDARKEIAKAGEEAEAVVMDLDKVTNKGLKSILKVVENAVNKFVNDTKNAIDKIFVDPFKVKIKLDEESTEGVKQNLSNDIVVSEAELSKNIDSANEAAKALVDTMKEILNLVQETGVASGSMVAGYTKTGRKRSENKIIEDLVGKLEQYRKAGNKIQSEIQDIFTKKPILLDLALKDGATDKVLKAIDESNFGYSLQRSLTHAQSIAESIVEVLKPLNGLEIKVGSSGKGTATGFANIREDLGQVFLKLNQIFDTLLKLHKYISGGNIKKTDDQLQQISVDFSEITEKIDTLIAAATALISTLTNEVSKINTSIETLDKNIDKAFDEKKIHAVSEEVKNIDLSSVNRNLAGIFEMLANIFTYIQSINGALKVTDSFKLGNKWSEVEKSFKSIANASGDIDLRKQKKDVTELLKLYEEYVNLGGTNDFSMLTTNQKTLTKLQSQANNFIGGRNVLDNDKLQETKDVLRQIDDVLSSLTISLSAINELDNVAGVFKALNIKQDNIDKIKALPGQLKQINDELRELDNVPYSGFIAQLSRITEQAEGLKALAEILRSSPTQIQNAIDKTNGGKENEKSLKEQLKIVTQLENQYKKLWNSGITEQSQPEKFADSLRAIEIILKDIHSIGEQKVINDSDIVTVKQLIDELKDWLVISEQIKYSTSELSNEFEKEAKTVKKYSDLFTKLYDDGAGEEGKSVEFIYYLHSIGALVERINDLQLKPFHTEEDVSYIKQANQELEKYSTKLNQIITEEKELEKNNTKDLSAKIRDALKVAQSYERNFARSWGFGKIEENYTNDYSARLDQIRGILNEIQIIKDKGISTLTEADLEQIKSYNEQLEEEFKELVKINQISKGTTISNLQNKMAQYILKNTRLSEGMVSQLVGYIKELDNVDDITKVRLNEIAEGFNRVQYSAKLAGREGTGFLDAIRNKLKYGWAQSIAMFFSFYDIVRYVREISGTVTELNSKLIELAKVSDASIGDLYKNFSDFSDIAKETGGTINDIISATADWARNGYNLEESKELARLSSIFQNIGDGLTANQSNEYLVSILKGFNLEANQAIEIMDKINNVSNNAASSVSNIGEALERSSSAFGAANTSLSEAVALLTTSKLSYLYVQKCA